MIPYQIVFTTTGDYEKAKEIANGLVGGKLAACVNIVSNITSIYRWQGNACQDQEQLLIIKTKKENFQAIQKRIHEIHNYEVPEIIAIEIAGGCPEYLKWLEYETATGNENG